MRFNQVKYFASLLTWHLRKGTQLKDLYLKLQQMNLDCYGI